MPGDIVVERGNYAFYFPTVTCIILSVVLSVIWSLFGEMDMRKKSKSSTTTELLPNPSPGEILLEEFLNPMALSQTALARAIGVPPRRINEIVRSSRERLEHY